MPTVSNLTLTQQSSFSLTAVKENTHPVPSGISSTQITRSEDDVMWRVLLEP